MTRPSKPTPPVQLEPASACPSKITVCPWHGPPPSTTPTALNLSANGAGVEVSPGSKAMVPVGFAGVPPQVHLVAACAEVTPPARTKALATAHALAPTIARNFTESAALFESWRIFTSLLPSWAFAGSLYCKHRLAQVSTCIQQTSVHTVVRRGRSGLIRM